MLVEWFSEVTFPRLCVSLESGSGGALEVKLAYFPPNHYPNEDYRGRKAVVTGSGTTAVEEGRSLSASSYAKGEAAFPDFP